MKKEISWKDLVKKTAEKHKKSGKSFDFKDVLADSGKEWKMIKSGKHEEYVQGKSSPVTRKNKPSNKKEKKSSKKSMKNSSHEDCDAEMILSKNILCKSCKVKVEKLVKTQSGGSKLLQLSPSEYKSKGGKLSELSPSEYTSSAQNAQAQAPAAQAQAQAPAPAAQAVKAPAPEVKAPASK
jgi:hypothetical protein